MFNPRPKEQYTADQERAFLKWVRTLPCCLTGQTPVEACHVRRISQGAGLGRKPRLYAVPMISEAHRYQHQHGELACIIRFQTSRIDFLDAFKGSEENAKIFFNNKAMQLRTKFLREIDK